MMEELKFSLVKMTNDYNSITKIDSNQHQKQ